MGEYLTWPKLVLMFMVMLGIQFITRTKAVADGMMFREMMIDLDVDANEIVRKMKEETDRMNKEDLNQEKHMGNTMTKNEKLDHMLALSEEVNVLTQRIQPHDTGYIHTTISSLRGRIDELREELSD